MAPKKKAPVKKPASQSPVAGRPMTDQPPRAVVFLMAYIAVAITIFGVVLLKNAGVNNRQTRDIAELNRSTIARVIRASVDECRQDAERFRQYQVRGKVQKSMLALLEQLVKASVTPKIRASAPIFRRMQRRIHILAVPNCDELEAYLIKDLSREQQNAITTDR